MMVTTEETIEVDEEDIKEAIKVDKEVRVNQTTIKQRKRILQKRRILRLNKRRI